MTMLSVKANPVDLFLKYFAQANTSDDSKFVCLVCYPDYSSSSTEAVKVYTKPRYGYTFVTQHFQLKHNELLTQETETNQSLLFTKDASDTYDWISWIVHENQPLSFCESDYVELTLLE